MTASLDDSFWRHPKVRDAPLVLVGLWAKSISFSSDMGYAGRVPTHALAGLTLVGPKRSRALADGMVKAGFWEPTLEGWEIHDYAQWNGKGKLARVSSGGLTTTRSRDLAWEAFLDVTGIEQDQLSAARRTVLNGMVRDLKDHTGENTAYEIKRRAANWPWPEVTITPEAFVKHWAMLGLGRRAGTATERRLAQAERLRGRKP